MIELERLRRISYGDAKRAGLTRYFTGVPCRYGHIAERRIPEGTCLECRSMYNAWRDMIRRCYDSQHKSYQHYGARGIAVCDRWRASYANFNSDMGGRPSPRHSIDRINNDGDYCRLNCRWATASEQRRNQRPTAQRRNQWSTAPARGSTLMRWGRWQAQIRVNGRNIYLGVFDTEAEANSTFLRAREARDAPPATHDDGAAA